MKKLLWLALVAGSLIYLGGYLAIAAYIKFGGNDVKDFCARQLHGKTPADIEVLAKQAGLATRQQPGLVRVTSGGRRTNHVCDLTIDAGRVTKAKANFRF